MRSVKKQNGWTQWLRKADSARSIDRVIDYFGEGRRPCAPERVATVLSFGVLAAQVAVRVRV